MEKLPEILLKDTWSESSHKILMREELSLVMEVLLSWPLRNDAS
jgi:hypothetical protein